ncbi:ATP-binding protein [Arthrobacter nitrophenolicus]|uniref:Helix-turn-helix transcriptional regulator n=1 Tax=Arthrobacter nitrophenolicus TaxID=683150 RepID=A0A4R5Y921_9MICC|nr:LuxR family transcriptional regulator [Arthrobacter nitrophenolicus]TDL41154.1 helix-turn-helix transcriptional regulator [Arthrobacter nitrophenolicus]
MRHLDAALPFIGRDRELSELRSLLERTRAGQGQAVTVVGEPGIGKTRLCEEALAEAQSLGFLVCTVRGRPTLSEIPMALTSGLVRSGVEQLSPGERASITSGLRGLGSITALGPAPDNQDVGEAAVLDSVSEFFKRLSSRRPVVAFVDGLERADEPSIRLLAAIPERLDRRPFLLVASTRRGTTPNQLSFTAEIASAGSAIRLSRLTQADTKALVALARTDLSAFERRAIVTASQGLPAYLAGALTQKPGSDGPPDPLRAMRDQLGLSWVHLSEPGREMLRILAVAGGPVADRLLSRIWPETGGTFTAALRETVDAELAISNAAGIQLSHPSYGEILLAAMFDHERREYHRRFAAELASPVRPADKQALADHLLHLADEVAPEVLRKTLSEAAAAPGIPDENLCLYLQHLLQILPVDAGPKLRYELYNQLGAAQQRVGKPELARASWLLAMKEADVKGSAAFQNLGSAQSQLAFQEWEAGAATEDDSGRYDEYRATLYKLIWTTRYGTVQQNLDAARAAICLEGTPLGAPLAELGRCFTDWTHRRYEDARQHALKACRTAQAEDVRNIVWISLSRVAPLTGHLQDSFEAVEALADTNAASRLSISEGATRSWAALTEHLAGNLQAAEEQLRPAVVIAAESGAGPVISRISLLMALLHAERGHLKEAKASLADAQRVRGATIWQADLQGLQALVRGVVALTADKPEHVPHVMSLTAGNYPVLTMLLPFLSGLAGLRTGDRNRVRDCLAMLLDVEPSQGRPVHALGMRLQGLDLVSGGEVKEGARYLQNAANILDECGLRLYASQARVEWAEAVESTPEATRVVPDLLRYFSEQDVGWWLQRTRRLARSIGYIEDRPHRNGRALSLREAEVVEQASLGLSNAVIAERLFLSERTVESHLRNVYKRLGLSSRVSLVSWAAEHPEEFSAGTDTTGNGSRRSSLP